MKKLCTIIGLFAFLLCVFTGCASTSNSPKGGEGYEGTVWEAFWETTSSSLGLEYIDYKMDHTAYSYVSESTTSDGYTAYYYLIKTAYETENVFGKKVLHPITARCYYVPEYSNTVYTTYMTIDGETVIFDEKTEDWLLDIGGSSAPENSEKEVSIVENKTEVTVLNKKIETAENNIDIEQPEEMGPDNLDKTKDVDNAGEAYYEDNGFDYSNDDLDYMRELAEMEWMNEFTSEEIIIDEYEESERDLDGIVSSYDE